MLNTIKQMIKALSCIVILTVIIAGCGGSSGGSSQTPPAVTPNIIIGNTDGLVYRNDQRLSGFGRFLVGGLSSLIISSSGDRYVGTSTGRLLKYSTVDQNWGTVATVDKSVTLEALTVTNENIIFGGGSDGHIYKYVVPAVFGTIQPFVDMGILDGSAIAAVITDPAGNLYGGTANGSVEVLRVGSKNWEVTGNGPIDGSSINALAINTIGEINIMAGTATGGLWQWHAKNYSWKNLNLPDYSSSITSIVAGATSNSFYIGTASGKVYSYDNSAFTLLGQPDGTAITSIVFPLGSTNALYTTTAGGNVNLYNIATSVWVSLGSPDGTSVNALMPSLSGIFAGTAGEKVMALRDFPQQLRWTPT